MAGRPSRTRWAAGNSPAKTPKQANLEHLYQKHQLPFRESTARHVVYVKGRRAGGTTGAALRLVELAHLQPSSRHLWADQTQRPIRRYVRRVFAPLLRGTRWRWDAQGLTLHFQGGALCDFGSATRPELLEGFGYDYLWINEAGHLLRDERLYFETLLPMVMESPKARVFIVGTPKGRGLFEQMYHWGLDPTQEGDWDSYKIVSTENRFVDAAWVERVRRQMPERAFRQEILAEFLDDAGSVFRDVERAATATPEAAPDPRGRYVLGVDVARYRDYTVAWVGRMDTNSAIACDRFQRLSWAQQCARLAELSRRHGNAPLYVDASNAGDALCDALEAEGLPVVRVRFTSQSKSRLVDYLAIALERNTLRLVPHEQTLRELRAFRYELTAAGHVRTGGYREHDDCVIALALCCWGMGVHGGRDFILGAPMETRELD